MNLEDKNKLADQMFEGYYAKSYVEDQLEDIFPGILHHIGFDYYDRSLEIYFNNNCPEDFLITEEHCNEIKDWGFNRIFFNFTNQTEATWHHNIVAPITQRRSINYSNRWSKEMCDNQESSF